MARILLLTASMGSGHDAAASELAAGCAARGHETRVVDLLTLYPCGTGRAMRALYLGMLRRAPWLYDAIYRLFFEPRSDWAPSVSPAVRLVVPATRRAVQEFRPDVVVSTFHLAGQAAGRLRGRGMPVPSVVVVTDAAAHRVWRARGTDLYLCVFPWVAEEVRASWGADAVATGPVIGQQARERSAPVLGTPGLPDRFSGRRPVLVSTGAWGVGDPARVARILHETGRYVAVVLCGRNTALRDRLTREEECIALGWTDDMPGLMARCCALVENGGGGATCSEAFAMGLPVTTFDPLPGHGRAGARALARAGVGQYAEDAEALVRCLDRACDPESPVVAMTAAAQSLTRGDATDVLLDWLGDVRHCLRA